MKTLEKITIDPKIAHGKPVIAGTRIMVYQVLELLEAGKTFDEIITDYFPDLTNDDIRACLRFANELLKNEEIHLLEKEAI